MTKSILFIMLLTCNAFSADKVYPTIIVDQGTSIYDGDTFRVDKKFAVANYGGTKFKNWCE